MPNFPKIDLTKFEVPKLPKLPNVQEIDLPTADQIGDCARNVVYMGVGLVVTTAERVVDTVKTTATKVREVRPVWPNRPAT
jgi:hypothetical protein